MDNVKSALALMRSPGCDPSWGTTLSHPLGEAVHSVEADGGDMFTFGDKFKRCKGQAGMLGDFLQIYRL